MNFIKQNNHITLLHSTFKENNYLMKYYSKIHIK
jgi:hypothetical protein